MKPNIGTTDRAVRAVLGVGLLVAAAAGAPVWLALPGVLMLATAGMRFCPAYAPFGFKTCAPDEKPQG